jgi:hypothetical protein
MKAGIRMLAVRIAGAAVIFACGRRGGREPVLNAPTSTPRFLDRQRASPVKGPFHEYLDVDQFSKTKKL